MIASIFGCGSSAGTWEDDAQNWNRAFNSTQPKDVNIIHSKFWISSHWTYEYITYLKFRASKKWINSFIQTNNLKVASGDFDLPDQAPNWFDPKIGQRAYIKNEFSQGSIYFVDHKTGEVLIYEIQL